MSRGQIWMLELARPDKRRPVLILSRSSLIPLLQTVTVAAVTSTLRGAPTEVATPANEFVVGGKNPVELLLEFGSTPSVARTEAKRADDGAMAAMARIEVYPPDSFPGEDRGQRILQLVHRGEGKEQSFPQSVTQDVVIDSPFDPWTWERADVHPSVAAVEAEVRDVLKVMARHLRERAFDRLLSYKQLGLAEWGVAYDEDVPDRVAKMRGVFDEELWARPDWNIEDVDPADYDLRLCAGGRLVECVTKTWEPILRTNPAPDGRRTRFAALLGRLRGGGDQLP